MCQFCPYLLSPTVVWGMRGGGLGYLKLDLVKLVSRGSGSLIMVSQGPWNTDTQIVSLLYIKHIRNETFVNSCSSEGCKVYSVMVADINQLPEQVQASSIQ